MTDRDRYDLVATVTDLLRGTLPSDQAARISERIKTDAEVYEVYLKLTMLEVSLEWTSPELMQKRLSESYLFGEPESSWPVTLADDPPKSALLGIIRHRTHTNWGSSLVSIAAVALLFYGTFALISWNLWPAKLPDGTDAGGADVAMIHSPQNVRWEASQEKSDAEPVKAGELLQIDSGTLTVQLNNGVTLRIEGPAAWTVENGNRATLQKGRLVADVPRGAVGFAVETPTARIVDLGTEFGVFVDGSSRTQVTVFRGEVLLTAMEPGRDSSQPPKPVHSQRLTASQASSVEFADRGQSRVTMRDVPFDRSGYTNMRAKRARHKHPGAAQAEQLPGGLALIAPSVVGVSSEHFGGTGSGGRLGSNVVNGYGLSAGPSGVLGAADSTHDNDEDTVWHQATLHNGRNTFISFSLGGVYDLKTTRIWNLNQRNTTQNGAREVEVWISSDDVNYKQLTTITLKQAGGTVAEPAQDFATAASGVKYVKFIIPTGYGFDPNAPDDSQSFEGFKGLSEVRFEGKPVSNSGSATNQQK